MSVLIVVAHPDDEVLGCGATASLLAARGLTVRACILSGQAAARRERPELDDLHGDMRRAQQILGLGEPVLGNFPNIKLNTVAHLELVLRYCTPTACGSVKPLPPPGVKLCVTIRIASGSPLVSG